MPNCSRNDLTRASPGGSDASSAIVPHRLPAGSKAPVSPTAWHPLGMTLLSSPASPHVACRTFPEYPCNPLFISVVADLRRLLVRVRGGTHDGGARGSVPGSSRLPPSSTRPWARVKPLRSKRGGAGERQEYDYQ